MTPLTLSGSPDQVPQTFPALLDLLESRPQPAVTWYGGAVDADGAERVELSGRVLQNWAVKLIGLFTQESELEPGDAVLVDADAHWKAAAVVLAAGALGWSVTVTASGAASEASSEAAEAASEAASGAAEADDDARAAAAAALAPALIITDRPGDWTGAGALAQSLGEAELAALSPGLLDASYEEATGEALPAWVLDISAEVRQHPDQLPAPLTPVALPEADEQSSAQGGLVLTGGEPSVDWQDWTLDRWGAGVEATGPAGVVVLAQLLQAWAHSRPVVLFQGDPAAQPAAWEQLLRNEGVS
ncbi:TIGR03089 family protein [Nesterenkonia sp. Act20]|uniref:TIGR03089 family protein n=1 Tax=Nesterenkonia sp. Act20 TaxID=1483432 RepID=UPI001C4703A0|nr:TIGR03089 family protein [Nesterenkonia sp. Act20]